MQSPAGWLVTGLIVSAMTGSGWAQTPGIYWRDAARFLALTDTQQAALARLHTAWRQHVELVEGAMAGGASARPGGGQSGTSSFCQQSQALWDETHRRARALLDTQQLAKLAVLDEAFRLMPTIDSAQAAYLLPRTLRVPPFGLPEGQVDMQASWQRVPAQALPGCAAPETVVRPGVGLEAPGRGTPPPRP